VILVLDASAIITLARVGCLNLLRELAEKVYIPEAVYDEVVKSGYGRPGSLEVEQAAWISKQSVYDQSVVVRLEAELGRGEAEAIVLAGELEADFVILDDATARRIAEAEGRKVLGLLGLLIRAKELGIVPVLRPVLNQIVGAGFFIDDALYQSILRRAGEEQPS
jgi:predicted nucleic acid-binding protein